MIHTIYIYFIINSFMVGYGWNSYNDWKVHLVFLLFGVPIYVIGLSYSFIVDIVWAKCLRVYYRILFTDYFAELTDYDIEIKTKQYKGTLKQGNFNAYNRFLMRMIDRKYNYGITKEKI